jgi:hypothetical protein
MRVDGTGIVSRTVQLVQEENKCLPTPTPHLPLLSPESQYVIVIFEVINNSC